MRLTAFHCTINRTSLRITCGHKEFATFARHMLAAHESPAGTEVDVSVHVSVRSGLPDLVRSARGATLQPDRSAGVAIDKTVWYNGDTTWHHDRQKTVRMLHRASAPHLEVTAQYRPRLDRSIRASVNPDVRFNTYQQALRLFVFHPLFLWEELNHGYRPLHAGVVGNGRRAVVLAGLSGVGKSTLSLYLASLPGWSLVSDNYALVSGSDVVGIQEPVRIDARTRALVGNKRLARVLDSRAVDGGRRRHAYPIASGGRNRVTATDLIFVTLGPRFALRRLSTDRMMDLLVRSENFLGEFYSYAELALPHSILPVRDRCAMRREFVNAVPSYLCTIARSEPLDVTVNRLADELQLL
jgi:hypothetical protein